MSRPADIPAPSDPSAPEYDAPPPGNERGFLQVNHPHLYPRRPSSQVDNPSEKPRVIVRG